jgi:hypothetical protein
LVLVPQPPILEMVSQKKFYHCLIKGEKKQKKPHKVSQVQMQYSFSKFFSMQV